MSFVRSTRLCNHRRHRQPALQRRQKSENDNNQNRKYKHVDERIRDTYAKDSKAASLINTSALPSMHTNVSALLPHRQRPHPIPPGPVRIVNNLPPFLVPASM